VLTENEQAESVEHVLRGDPQCVFCLRWMPIEKMRRNLSGERYACKGHVESQNCLNEIWARSRKQQP
jgi:hypothetical protein